MLVFQCGVRIRHRQQCTPTLGAEAGQPRIQRVGLLHPIAVRAFGLTAEGPAFRQIERSPRLQRDGAADAAIQIGGGGRFDDVYATEQRRWNIHEVRLCAADVRLTILIAATCTQIQLTIHGGLHLRHAADIELRTFAGRAPDLHARHALQRIGDGDVGQFADVFGRDRIDDLRGAALVFDGLGLRTAHALDHHLVQFGDAWSGGSVLCARTAGKQGERSRECGGQWGMAGVRMQLVHGPLPGMTNPRPFRLALSARQCGIG